MPIVSITLSTYNVQEFVRSSLECIVNQTLKDIEVICIDDGSEDDTPSILKEFELEDSRIQVIVKEKNEGLAVSRNEALKLAKGKYVAFVDGDDLMDLTLFEKAVAIAEQQNSDMVMWDYRSFVDTVELDDVLNEDSALSKVNPNDKISLLQRPAFTWTKLIKTEKAKELGIHFPKGLTRQDIPVHWHLITELNKISILPEKLSFYRQQAGATTHKKDEKLFHLATVMDITKQYLNKAKLYAVYKDEFLRQQLNLLFGMYDNVNTSLKKEAIVLIKDRLESDQIGYIHSNKPLRMQARMYYKGLLGSLVGKVKFKFWKLTRSIYRDLSAKA
jgi:glycosyltransferase involved in cell wall biosynthesis